MRKLTRILSKHNFSILFKALKNEPPLQVLKNGLSFLIGKGKSQPTSLLNLSADKEWSLNIDSMYHSEYSDSLIINGWFISKSKSHSYVIEVNNDPVELFYYRNDVATNYGKSYPSNIFQAGFSKVLPFAGQESILLTLKKDGVEVIQKKVKPTKVMSIEHLPISRNQQYGFYVGLKERNFKLQLPNDIQGPKISIIIPVYNVSLDYLKPCIDSVLNQRYTNWELCICDDKSTRLDTVSFLKSIANVDPRIKVLFSKTNQNISGASNSALSLATGEFVSLLDHDDVLHLDALYHVAKYIKANPKADILYSDEDKLDKNGQRVEPYYKPQYSRELLLANNYICHLLTIRKTLGDDIGWFRLGFEGAQDHDLILRLVEKTNDILHIPEILYHWRKIEGSTALAHGEKSYANKAGLKTVREALKRRNIEAKVKSGDWAGSYKIKYDLTSSPKISIVIPFKDKVGLLKTCMSSIFEKTKYSNVEILLVNNNSSEKETIDYLGRFDNNPIVKVIHYDGAFNYSKINNYAINKSEGDILLLLNNDIKVITTKWLTKMLRFLQQKEVGAVGAHLLYEDDTNQHNGVVLGIGGVAGHAFKGLDATLNHYYLDGVPRNVSGCTAACLMFEKKTWESVKGLNEEQLTVAFNDVDFCLKIRSLNKEIIYVNDVKMYHYESKSRGYEDTPEKVARFKIEEKYMKDTWSDVLKNDPFYNPNLSLIRQDYGLNMEGVIKEYLRLNK